MTVNAASTSQRSKMGMEEWLRKLLHLFVLCIPFGIYYLPGNVVRPLLTGAAVLFVLTDLARIHVPTVRRWVGLVFGPFLRREEDVKLTGASYLMASSCLCMFLFRPSIALTALSFIILGDAAAALVGINWGRIRIGKKSIEGTVACGLVCMAFWYVISRKLEPGIPLGPGMAAAWLTALLELMPFKVNDNFIVPIATGTMLHFWL